MKKNSSVSYAILAVVFILFNICAFVIPADRAATFYIAYAFTLVAFGVEVYVLWQSIKQIKMPKSRILGFPISYVGIVYLTVQVVAFALFVLFPDAPVWLTVIACALILGLAVIFMLTIKSAVNEIARVEEKVNKKVSFIKMLQVDIEMLAEAETDSETKTALLNFAKAVRFSDPMSNDILADLEAKIVAKVEEMKLSEDKKPLIKQAELLLVERNKKCKVLK